MTEKVIWSVGDLRLAIGRQVLFDNTQLSVHDGERIGLVGRNGCGKSTFLKIIAGLTEPANGNFRITKDLRVAYLPQDFELGENITVEQSVRQGLRHLESLLQRYEQTRIGSKEHEEIEHLIHIHDGWQLQKKLDAMIEKLALPDRNRLCSELSGGEKRRVTLARALISEPDLLLLDEPTNHLDVTTITWIENFLAKFTGACLFVTHDRYFLDRLSSRIVELDNGKFFSNEGSYADFLEAKAEREYAEDQEEGRRRKFLRSEIEWVRRSPKARLKRNLGRVKRYDEIAAKSGPERTGEIELLIPPPARLGNKTVNLQNISLTLGGKPLFSDFNFEFAAGRKIGIVGPNGIGKTSLLRVLTGQLPPDSGKVEIAQTVEFNYIAQEKLQLNPEKTVYEEIGEGLDFVMLGSDKITIWSYLKRFLFEDERIKTLIKELSGGERARLTLAKILKQGGNFIILDEPTNDLDLSSLRLLEESLIRFEGCLLTVSHDRYFLNRVCDGIIAFEENGGLVYNVGDYDSYLANKEMRQNRQPVSAAAPPVKTTKAAPRTESVKLTFKENRELQSIEEDISALEARIVELETCFASPDFYTEFGNRITELQKEFDEANIKLPKLYERWDFLQTKAGI